MCTARRHESVPIRCYPTTHTPPSSGKRRHSNHWPEAGAAPAPAAQRAPLLDLLPGAGGFAGAQRQGGGGNAGAHATVRDLAHQAIREAIHLLEVADELLGTAKDDPQLDQMGMYQTEQLQSAVRENLTGLCQAACLAAGVSVPAAPPADYFRGTMKRPNSSAVEEEQEDLVASLDLASIDAAEPPLPASDIGAEGSASPLPGQDTAADTLIDVDPQPLSEGGVADADDLDEDIADTLSGDDDGPMQPLGEEGGAAAVPAQESGSSAGDAAHLPDLSPGTEAMVEHWLLNDIKAAHSGEQEQFAADAALATANTRGALVPRTVPDFDTALNYANANAPAFATNEYVAAAM
ncbi:hypothetical protein JKP88DRAFT_284379 [Tribonema minus]|uniref:Uncharacterized protein n=1 Tax=Tribonema minus TaxID=303371 RepID=A0A835ZJT1_9STRA|nr:hypothetical protein JKP88DRAFT_284379 [Tribonema minus]